MGKTRQGWLLTGLVIMALLGAGYFFAVKPQASKVKQVESETATKVEANNQVRGQIALLETQKIGVIAQVNRLRQIDVLLPSNPALPRLVRSVSKITATTGVDLTSMAPGTLVAVSAAAAQQVVAKEEPVAGSSGEDKPVRVRRAPAAAGLSAMPVTMTFSGDFARVQLFLAGLEKSLDRAFVVDTLTVTPAAEGAAASAAKKKSVNTLLVSIAGRAFVKAVPVAAPVVKTPVPPVKEK